MIYNTSQLFFSKNQTNIIENWSLAWKWEVENDLIINQYLCTMLEAFGGLILWNLSFYMALYTSNNNASVKSMGEYDYSICMQVVNFWNRIKAEPGWINFQSLIFINSSFRKKYKEMTQLPSEHHCRATALQSQVHNTILIDQEGVNPHEERWKSIRFK